MAFLQSGGSVVGSAQINDGAIVNADVNAAAAIAATKLSGLPYQVIGDITLGSTGNTLELTSLPARTFLRCIMFAPSTASSQVSLNFNGDVAANYDRSYSIDGGGTTPATAQSTILMETAAQTATRLWTVDIINVATSPKLVRGFGQYSHRFYESGGAWNNSSVQIDRITFNATTFAIGSRLIVMGMNS